MSVFGRKKEAKELQWLAAGGKGRTTGRLDMIKPNPRCQGLTGLEPCRPMIGACQMAGWLLFFLRENRGKSGLHEQDAG